MEDTHIFDVEVRIVCPYTTGPVEAGLNEGAVRVEVINDGVGVLLFRRRENDHLEVLIGSFETLASIGSYVDTGEDWLWLLRKHDGDDDLGVISIDVIDAVDQSFVKVKDHSLRFGGMVWLRKVYNKVRHLSKGWSRQPTRPNVKQGLHSLVEVDLLNIWCLVTLLIVIFVSAAIRVFAFVLFFHEAECRVRISIKVLLIVFVSYILLPLLLLRLMLGYLSDHIL